MRENDTSSDRAAAVRDEDELEPRVFDAALFDVDDDPVVPDAGRRTRRVLVGAIAGVVVVIVLAALLLRRESAPTAGAASAPGAEAAVAPVAITTSTAIGRELPLYIEATGSLIAYESADVAPEISGQILATPVDVGDFVRAGAVIAKLDDRDAKLRVRQAEAALAQARASVRQAREKLGGQSDPARVAEVEAARAQMELAEANERRYRALVESGDVPRAQYDEMRARALTARNQFEAALAAARSGGAGIDVAASSVEAAEAQLALARKALADTAIVAPFDGFVSERPAAAGEWVTPQSKVATLVQTAALKLVLTISEADAARIRLGMPVTLAVDAFPGREFTGTIGAINPSLDSGSRSLMAIVGVRNPDNALRPGMFATARVTEPAAGRTGVIVPAQAVVQTSTGSSRVFVIRDGRAEARVVTVGQRDGADVQIISGITEGEEVAVSAVDRLSDGALVTR